MAKDTVLAMLKALPGTREDGGNMLIDEAWDVTMHTGRNGAVLSVQALNKVTIQGDFLIAETHKGQRVVMLLEEVRGFIAEPSTNDRRGRKTGFA